MRATNDRLAEKFIVIVARELGKALKGLHEAGIIHRDIKAANVLIHEDGNLQLCDFGVANVLDTRTDKRRTFIGTLHWMPPELWTEKPEYSDEVDVWEYGCTLYECALGRPPNSDVRERQQLRVRMRRLKQSIALPESEQFSDGLRDLVKFALSPEVTTRPSMKDVLEHHYLKETEDTHPTSDLTELVQNYYAWLFGGGQRVSLFMPGGAPAAATEDPDAQIHDSDEWNFSTTQDFERRLSTVLNIPDLSDLSAESGGDDTPRGLPANTELSPPRELTAAQKANFEARVNRGAADLSNLFDQSGPAYEYKTKNDFIPVPEQTSGQRRISDLPFRAMAEDRPSSIASNVIDLGDFDQEDYAVAPPRTDDNIQTTYADTSMKEQTIRLADAATLRQKRADSKGPRDPTTQNLTARRDSSVDADRDAMSTGIAAQDFASAQEDWASGAQNKQPSLQEAAEITSNKTRATMDWSFATAMADMGGTVRDTDGPTVEPVPIQDPTTSMPAYGSATNDEPGPEEEEEDVASALPSRSQSRARDTLEWSFGEAMAELNDNPSTSAVSPSAQRLTPSRPTGLTRQMTMPVTSADYNTIAEAADGGPVDDAEDDDEDDMPARPSTAMSDAHSVSSLSSVDMDPFALENRGLGSARAIAGFEAGPGPAQGVGVGVGGGGDRMVVNVPEVLPPSVAALSANASNEELEAALEQLLQGFSDTLGAASAVFGAARDGRGRGRGGLVRGRGRSGMGGENGV
jgi:serine/threonine protein kinase